MGKRVIDAADVPGFLVNRCSRPFGLEAQKLLAERAADLETIDRICRLEGGFKMGPFELSDLVGVDVGFEIAKSFYERLRRASLAAEPARGEARRRWLSRAQERSRLVLLRRRPAPSGRPRATAAGRRRRASAS